MPSSKTHSSAATTSKDSSRHSSGGISVDGMIELTENAGIDHTLGEFVKDLKAEAARLGDSPLKNVKLFYETSDGNFPRKIPNKVKVVLEHPEGHFVQISKGASTSSVLNAFLRCEKGLSSYFASDPVVGQVIEKLLKSVHDKVDEKK